MAGHSQFANIMHRKGAQDKKRARLFAKLVREIIVSAKMGMPDPAHNPRLRAAIAAARAQSVPKEKIENAVKKATNPQDGDNYEEIRYEGYGPGGVALVVTALTDNRNRTASDVRSVFTKRGGNMGETGSVSFMFTHMGYFLYPKATASDDAMLEAAIEAGADNCESSEHGHVITCEVENFAAVRDALVEKLGDAEETKLVWMPQNTVSLDEEQAKTVLALVDALDELDDVQQVFGNYEISEELLAKLDAA